MISIIVVTWNSAEYLFSCLRSVKEQTETDLELIIVDNNSKDSTKEIISLFESDIFIENSVNMGFAAANNQGIKASRGEYVLTLNPDVILGPDYLKKVKEKITENEDTGMVSGKLVRPAQAGSPSGVIDSQGLYLSNSRRFYDIGQGEEEKGIEHGAGSMGQGDKKSQVVSNKSQAKSERLIGPCAAAGFYLREMLEEIKIEGEYFDEDFFAYVEDVDLAWRANIFGWKAVYCPEAKAVHFRGGSSVNSEWMQYLSFRNRYLMMIKNETTAHFIKYLYLFILYDLFRFIYLLFKNKYVFNSKYKNSNLINKAWKKRKLILKN
ncbi:MAG: glycosyltransferase family 2 protein [bacterium]|nr:glycosyltransferase family 2 protein [bacterium]